MTLKNITPIDEYLAQKLRQLRRISGISQEKLGELTGLTFQQIQKYEAAKNRIPASRLFEFSQIFQQPLSAFFEGISADQMYYNYEFESEKKLQEKSDEITNELLPLISAFKKIEDSQARKNLIAIANSLSSKAKKIKHSYN